MADTDDASARLLSDAGRDDTDGGASYLRVGETQANTDSSMSTTVTALSPQDQTDTPRGGCVTGGPNAPSDTMLDSVPYNEPSRQLQKWPSSILFIIGNEFCERFWYVAACSLPICV